MDCVRSCVLCDMFARGNLQRGWAGCGGRTALGLSLTMSSIVLISDSPVLETP